MVLFSLFAIDRAALLALPQNMLSKIDRITNENDQLAEPEPTKWFQIIFI